MRQVDNHKELEHAYPGKPLLAAGATQCAETRAVAGATYRCARPVGHAGDHDYAAGPVALHHKPGEIREVHDLPQLGPCSGCHFWLYQYETHPPGGVGVCRKTHDHIDRWHNEGCGEFLQKGGE
ncbi:MAG: hypothetical protein V3W41_14690 [Planctomycetota bacterium]